MELQNLQVQELTMQEALSVEGGYSWSEFKQDCKDAWDSFTQGVSDSMNW